MNNASAELTNHYRLEKKGTAMQNWTWIITLQKRLIYVIGNFIGYGKMEGWLTFMHI
jgi:hypothetical protein